MSFFFIDDVKAPITLAQKGYGYMEAASSSSDLALSYANVSGGSAPAAGDFVVWIIYAYSTAGQAINDLTGSGWTQDRLYASTTICSSVLAKVASSGDISSPATGVTAMPSYSVAMWVAYSVTGAIGTVAVNSHGCEFGNNSAPASDALDSTSVPDDEYAVTVAVGGGTDGAIGLNWTGATPDVTVQRSNVGGSTIDLKFGAVLSLGGANISISKDDDGTLNSLASAYVSVT